MSNENAMSYKEMVTSLHVKFDEMLSHGGGAALLVCSSADGYIPEPERIFAVSREYTKDGDQTSSSLDAMMSGLVSSLLNELTAVLTQATDDKNVLRVRKEFAALIDPWMKANIPGVQFFAGSTMAEANELLMSRARGDLLQ